MNLKIKRSIVSILVAVMIMPTFIITDFLNTQAAYAESDEVAPVLEELELISVKNGGEGSDLRLNDKGEYTLGLDGLSTSEYVLNIGDSLTSEPLKPGVLFPLYLNPSLIDFAALSNYYNSKPEPWRSYLQAAAAGSEPFVLIYSGDDGSDLALIDAAKYMINGDWEYPELPGDFLPGLYRVSGSIFDPSNNVTAISISMRFDNTAPTLEVSAPVKCEDINGGEKYNIQWSAADLESGIPSDSVNLYFYNGSAWETLAIGQANSGSFEWSVPAVEISKAKIRVTVENYAGLVAEKLVRRLDIADYAAPVITLKGDNAMTVAKGSIFSDPGALVTDNYDGESTIYGFGSVDTSVIGEYILSYDATDAAGNVANQVLRTVKVVDGVLSVPGGLAAMVADGRITLNWSAVTGATFYNVCYKKSAEASGMTCTSVSATSAEIIGLVNGVKYYFTVEAMNSYARSGLATIEATPTIKLATAPTQVQAPANIINYNVAQAAEPQVESNITSSGDENGKIKGEEESDQSEADEEINWTPWIILFILIILAGAATGGYFYWFAGEDEMEKKTQKPVEPAAPVKKNEDSKKSVSDQKSTKKPKRW